MAQRLIEHLVSYESVFYIMPEDVTPDDVDPMDLTSGSEEVFAVLEEVTDDTFVIGSERFAAWRIAQIDGDGVRLYCTAWNNGIDPRSKSPDYDDCTHADPEGKIPLAICPVHEL